MAAMTPSSRTRGPAAPILHRAARIEDRIHGWREAWARRGGKLPVVVPYTGYGDGTGVRVLCRVLLARPQRHERPAPSSIRGWRSFTSVPVAGAEVVVRVGEVEHRLVADRGGVVDAVVAVELEPGWREITLSSEGSEPVTARIFVVDPATRFGIVSDIDDTVMVTALPRPFLAAWNTFVLDEHARRPVPGVNVLYDRLQQAHPGAPIIYLSTGAWNVAPTLDRFLSRHLSPAGPLLLTDWGPTTDRWFRSGQEHKRENLARLAREFPNVRWLLVGDDGQHDPGLYGDFAEQHPENVAAVAIRTLSVGEAVWAGGRARPDEHDDGVAWLSAPDGAGLAEQLVDIELLDRRDAV